MHVDPIAPPPPSPRPPRPPPPMILSTSDAHECFIHWGKAYF